MRPPCGRRTSFTVLVETGTHSLDLLPSLLFFVTSWKHMHVWIADGEPRFIMDVTMKGGSGMSLVTIIFLGQLLAGFPFLMSSSVLFALMVVHPGQSTLAIVKLNLGWKTIGGIAVALLS